MAFDACPGLETDRSGLLECRRLLAEPLTKEKLFLCAEFLRESRGSRFVRLPPVLSMETEAFGASVVHDEYGRRLAGNPVLEKTALETPALLPALPLPEPFWLPESPFLYGHPVLYGLTGACSLALNLVGLRAFSRLWRKNPEMLQGFLERLNGWQIGNCRKAAERGIRFFYFADPSADPSVLGAERYEALGLRYQQAFLEAVYDELKMGLMVVCKKTAAGLLEAELLRQEACPWPEGATAGLEERILAAAGDPKIRIAGGHCLMQDSIPAEPLCALFPVNLILQK